MLTNELSPLSSDYCTLGVQLGMSLDEIKTLEKQYMKDGKRVLLEILDWWLKQGRYNDRTEMWETIVSSLIAMNWNRLAAKIRRKYLDINVSPSCKKSRLYPS